MSAEESLHHSFKRFIASYKSAILDSDCDSAVDPRYQRAVAAHIATAEGLWELVARVGLHNVATSTDTIDDLPTATLELLRLPFLLGDLWSRVQGREDADEAARNGDDDDDDPTSPAARRRRQQQLQQKNGGGGSSSAATGGSSSSTDNRANGYSVATRAEALVRSQRWLEVLLRMAVDLELLQAKDIEIHLGNVFEEGVLRRYGGDGDDSGDGVPTSSTRVMNHTMASRTAKIQLAQHQRDMGRLLRQAEGEMAFRRAKAARMRRLAREDNDDNNSRASSDSDNDNGEEKSIRKALKVDTETGRERDFAASGGRSATGRLCGVLEVGGANDGVDDEDEDEANEETRRMLAVLYLKWCTGEAIQNVIMSNRELEMVTRLTPAARRAIAAEYQEQMARWAERANSDGRNTYTILPGGLIAPGHAPMHSTTFGTNHVDYREQVRAELMVDRNRPTMTLEEYAQMEMAGIAEQQARADAMGRERAEEDERLGEDGIEERERQKLASQDDWRDDHPAYGITNKGNYS